MEEIWADVYEYEGLYQVSNLGNVLSLPRQVRQGKYGKTRPVGGKMMKATDNGNGYLTVSLTANNARKRYYVHRLVADHFVPNLGGGNSVNHKDFDKYNNRADNLEWCTQAQNVRYSSQRMRKSHKQWKQAATTEKYIYFRNGRYRLSIRNKIDKTYPTLEEAIRAREVVMDGEKYIAG